MQRIYDERNRQRIDAAQWAPLRRVFAFLMCLAVIVGGLLFNAAPASAATCAGTTIPIGDLDLCKTFGGSLGPTGKVDVGGLGLWPQGFVNVQKIDTGLVDATALALAVADLNSEPRSLRVGMIDKNGDGKYRKIGNFKVSGWPANGWLYANSVTGNVPKALGRGDVVVVSLRRDKFRWKHSILAGKVTTVD